MTWLDILHCPLRPLFKLLHLVLYLSSLICMFNINKAFLPLDYGHRDFSAGCQREEGENVRMSLSAHF